MEVGVNIATALQHAEEEQNPEHAQTQAQPMEEVIVKEMLQQVAMIYHVVSI